MNLSASMVATLTLFSACADPYPLNFVLWRDQQCKVESQPTIEGTNPWPGCRVIIGNEFGAATVDLMLWYSTETTDTSPFFDVTLSRAAVPGELVAVLGDDVPDPAADEAVIVYADPQQYGWDGVGSVTLQTLDAYRVLDVETFEVVLTFDALALRSRRDGSARPISGTLHLSGTDATYISEAN